MAPLSGLTKRYCDFYGCYDNDNGSGWDNWGRWVALVVIIVFFLVLAFLFSCLNTRRRRRRGMAPMYGTGWMPYTGPHQQGQHQNKPPGHNQNEHGYYSHEPYGGAAPPPPYMGNQATGTTFRSEDGYYGAGGNGAGQGIELQQPQSSYAGYGGRGGENVYEAPPGAPPRKGDGVIR